MNIKAGLSLAALAVLATAYCAGAETANTARSIKTGVYAGRGISGNGATEWFRIVERSPELELKIVDSEMIRAGGSIVETYDAPSRRFLPLDDVEAHRYARLFCRDNARWFAAFASGQEAGEL